MANEKLICSQCGYEAKDDDRVLFFDHPITGKIFCQKCGDKPPKNWMNFLTGG